MATQNEAGIEFAVIPEENQQHFRLLELPPDLLNALTSENPPILQLKSTQNDTGNNSAVLCSPNRTYDIRQVSTSNSVFVAEAISRSRRPDDLPQPVLQAIAQPQSTLEVSISKHNSASPHILAALPSYTSTGHYSSNVRLTKEELFANIPLSHGECEAAWRQLACFEHGDDRHAAIPTANLKLKVWEALLRAATATGIDLTETTNIDDLRSIVNTENDWPEEVPTAFIQSLSRLDGQLEDPCLDPEVCARSIGQALLRDLTEASKDPVSTTAFKAKWADLLPEKWREHAELRLIAASYRLDDTGKNITYAGNSAESADPTNRSPAAEAKSTLGAKRKWHEKFRASKKT